MTVNKLQNFEDKKIHIFALPCDLIVNEAAWHLTVLTSLNFFAVLVCSSLSLKRFSKVWLRVNTLWTWVWTQRWPTKMMWSSMCHTDITQTYLGLCYQEVSVSSICVSYLSPLDEVMYLRTALGTSIVSSFTSTTSKAFTYDSLLSSTCSKHCRWLITTWNLRCNSWSRRAQRPDHWGSQWWGCSGARPLRRPQSGLLKSPPAAARWAGPAALWEPPRVTSHLLSCWRSGSADLWRLAASP